MSSFTGPLYSGDELAEADNLFEQSLRLKNRCGRDKMKVAADYADQAYSIYKRHNSPHAEEALTLRDEIHAKLKQH